MTGPQTFTLTFTTPQAPPSFAIADAVGEVLLVIIGGHHPQVPTKDYGIKPALSLTVVPLTGRGAGVPIEDVVLFGKASECFPGVTPGTAALTTVIKSGRAYLFDPATSEYATQLAQQWLASVGDVQALVANAIRNHAEQARGSRRPRSTYPRAPRSRRPPLRPRSLPRPFTPHPRPRPHPRHPRPR
jgi:hypothetical protein